MRKAEYVICEKGGIQKRVNKREYNEYDSKMGWVIV